MPSRPSDDSVDEVCLRRILTLIEAFAAARGTR